MIRNGATDNVLSYLSTEDVLKLRNVSNGQWEGMLTIRPALFHSNQIGCRIPDTQEPFELRRIPRHSDTDLQRPET